MRPAIFTSFSGWSFLWWLAVPSAPAPLAGACPARVHVGATHAGFAAYTNGMIDLFVQLRSISLCSAMADGPIF